MFIDRNAKPPTQHRLHGLLISITLLIVVGNTAAQAVAVQETSSSSGFVNLVADAQAKTNAKDWIKATELWELVVKANPLDGGFWSQLGHAYYFAKNYRKSTAAYEKQIELGGVIPANAAYNVACNYALLGEKESALKWLEKALSMGYADLPHAQADADLEPLHADPRFRNLVGLIDTSKMSREEGWRSDLQLLSREVKRKGYHLFPRTGTEADFDQAVKTLSDAIPKLTDMQMIVEIAKLMLRVGDGHSGIMGGLRPEFLPNLPVQFYLFQEGLFIIAADQKYKDLIGSKVLKFGERSPDEIVNGIEPIINRDNDIWIKQVAPYRMRSLPLLNALGLVRDTEKVSLTVRGLDGMESVVSVAVDNTQPDIWNVKPNPATWTNLPQMLASPLPLYLRNPAALYWFEYLRDNKTVYFGFNSIQNDPKESLADFSARMFKFINENEVEKLIIDLRWNNGGNTMILDPLIHGLIKNDKINRQGRLFVIIGRRTFSAAQNFSTLVERYTNAIFVGEPTGSRPNFVGEERPFTMPYSKLLINVSDLYWETSYPFDKRTWIAPQIFLPPTFEAYRKNRDPVLDAILGFHP